MVRYSQNFLVNTKVLPQIIKAADLHNDDIVVEIGPGRGVMTELLCQKVKKVIAIEIDKILIDGLVSLSRQYSNLTVINADFCRYNWRQLLKNNQYKIVANIPYHVTGLILRTIFDGEQTLPITAVLMVQLEVAKKIIPRENNQSILSNLIKSFGSVKMVAKVDRQSFRPSPKVDSAIIAIENIKKPDVDNFDEYFRIIKICFAHRRKTLLNNLSAGLAINKQTAKEILWSADIDPTRRAQTVSIAEWKKLYLNIKQQNINPSI